MKKTVREWLAELPAHVKPEPLCLLIKSISAPTLQEALRVAFRNCPPCDRDFWFDLMKRETRGEFDKPRSFCQTTPDCILDAGPWIIDRCEAQEIAALKKRIAELEARVPKKEWWEQYKVGDKIDLIGLEIISIMPNQDRRLRVKDGTNGWAGTSLYFDDRHIRPHQP